MSWPHSVGQGPSVSGRGCIQRLRGCSSSVRGPSELAYVAGLPYWGPILGAPQRLQGVSREPALLAEVIDDRGARDQVVLRHEPPCPLYYRPENQKGDFPTILEVNEQH